MRRARMLISLESGICFVESELAGHYNIFTGQEACLGCPQGKYEDARGSVACPDCEPGQYHNDTARSECTACEAGLLAVGALCGRRN